MLDAVGYLVDNGIKWRAMPADFPPWDRVYARTRASVARQYSTRLPENLHWRTS
ncbi:transposase [Streptomyces sp. NPDC004393]|uniref:transposase n=1 Tax=Streptomyces sp. NPDC004533 TaxID=3154278 RepID=UPI0033B5DF61